MKIMVGIDLHSNNALCGCRSSMRMSPWQLDKNVPMEAGLR